VDRINLSDDMKKAVGSRENGNVIKASKELV